MELDPGTGVSSRWRQRLCGIMAGGLAVLAVTGAVRTGQLQRDRDGDGIPDCREQTGLEVVGTSAVLQTDPDDDDTDDDQVSDGGEMGLPMGSHSRRVQVRNLFACETITYAEWSDPTLADKDDDGLIDAVELSEGTDPHVADTDRDDLDDYEEREWGSDPYAADTDADGFPDGDDLDDGRSPVVADEAIDSEEWHLEYAKGVGLGEFDDIDSVPQLLGALSGGMSGSIPVVGWFVSTVGDLRDAIAGIVDDDWSAVLTSATAVLPFAGDSAKATKQITKFVEKHPEQLRRVVAGILALEKVPEPVRTTLLRAADKDGVDGLRTLEVSDEVIIKFAKRGSRLATLAAAAATASSLVETIPSTHTDDDGFVETLADAQAALREYAAGDDESDDVGSVYLDEFPASDYVGGRLIDACAKCANEPEPGKTTLRIARLSSLHFSDAIRGQIDKDAYLIGRGYDLEWHFFAGPSGWTVDTSVLDALDDSGIPLVIHLPG